MDKQKGFTLVEILGVLVLLGVVALIAIPTITGSITKSKQRADEINQKIILEASKSWASENTSSLSTSSPIFVKVSTLISGGYVDGTNIDKINDSTYSDKCIEINYNSKYSNYDYTITACS